jgi:hypothetical protein
MVTSNNAMSNDGCDAPFNDNNSIEQITFDNFLKYLGQEVTVEIMGYHGCMIYPCRNILIGMNKGEYFFKSIEDDGTNQYWSFGITDEKWDCQVFSIVQNAEVSDTTGDDSSNADG